MAAYGMLTTSSYRIAPFCILTSAFYVYQVYVQTLQRLQPWRAIWPAAQSLEYQDEAAVRREPPVADDQ